MRVKQKVTEVVEKKAAALLLKDREYTAKNLKREVEKSLRKDGKTYKFTERTYNNIKNRILQNIITDNPLDQKWSVGACEKNNIPDDMIPLLMERMKIFRRFDEWEKQLEHMPEAEWDALAPESPEGYLELGEDPITIRVARWMSRLKLLVDKLIEKYKNDDVDPPGTIKDKEFALHWLLYYVAYLYADTERISESLGHKYFNSSEIDELLFMKDHANYDDFQDDLQKASDITDRKLKKYTGKIKDMKIRDMIEKDIRLGQQQNTENGGEANGKR